MDEPNLPPSDSPLLERYRKVLLDFVRTVDATGGVFREDPGGCHAPLADPEWIDLAEAYVAACTVLKRQILLAPAPAGILPDPAQEQGQGQRQGQEGIEPLLPGALQRCPILQSPPPSAQEL